MKETRRRTLETSEARVWRLPAPVAAAVAMALAAMMLLAAVAPAKAQSVTTFTVDREDDRTPALGTCTATDNDCALRDAIFNANASTADEVVIDFAVDTVTLSIPGFDDNAQAGDLDITRTMTIEGGGVIIGADQPTFANRIFHVATPHDTPSDAAGTEAIIEGVTIEDGTAPANDPFGGGILVNEWASLTLSDSTVRKNVALAAGGGIYLSNEQQTVKDGDASTILPGGKAKIDGSLVSENEAGFAGNSENDPFGGGGGILAARGSSLSISDSEVSTNKSNNLSGGIASDGPTNIVRTTISDNTALAFVGGLGIGNLAGTNENTFLFLADSTISGNTGNAAGGLGIVDAPAAVVNSTISGNMANGAPTAGNQFGGVGGGVGVLGSNPDLELDSVTVAENIANTAGGGLASTTPGGISALNTIVADNTPTETGQCFAATDGAIVSAGFNLEFPGTSCGFENTGEDPLLEDLGDNDGPTFTHSLPKDSPAVDRGDTELDKDQRGKKRPSNFTRIANAGNGDGSDIGAFELQAPPPDGGGSKPKKPKKPSSKKCTIVGTPGNDILRGTPGRNVICGLGGDDIIRGLGGNDLIKGGAGDDILYGGPGNDVLLGGPGKDVLRGESGKDKLVGGPGKDSVKQ